MIKMMKDSIESSDPITKEKIINLYLDVTFYGNKEKVERRYFAWYGKWAEGYDAKEAARVTREQMAEKKYYCESMAIRWFKNKLGEAILKGKLIAIPVIEI